MRRLAHLGLSVSIGACASNAKDSADERPPLIDPALEPLIWPMADQPELPADPTNAWADDEAAAWFGRFLFFDPRLSASGTVACSSCHDPLLGFGDGKPLSEGLETTLRHAPTIWNVGHQRWLYWDGRCDSLWCQAASPIEAPGEMNLPRTSLARVIYDEPDLRSAYTQLFGSLPDVSDTGRFPPAARPVPSDPEDSAHEAWEGMTTADQNAVTRVLVHISKAIAAYERTVRSTETPVDRFIQALSRGDRAAAEGALTEPERLGLELFAGEGQCVFCHSGWLFSNKEFHNIGLPVLTDSDTPDTARYDGITAVRAAEFNSASVWSDEPNGEAADLLSRIIQSPEQLGQFKTPSLRGVAHHPPYMHGGHFNSLQEVVGFYATPGTYDGPGHREELLLTQEWGEEEKSALVDFLEALSDTAPAPTVLISPPATPLP